MASALFTCDSVEKDYSRALHNEADLIKDVSGISCEGWSLLDIATALKMIWKPKKVGNSSLVNCRYYFVNVLSAACYPISCKLVTWSKSCFFQVSKDEALRLVNDASKYEALVNKYALFRAYKEILKAHNDRISKEELLKSLVEGLKKP